MSQLMMRYCLAGSRPARWTAFAVWVPKKMYRISVFFFLALSCA